MSRTKLKQRVQEKLNAIQEQRDDIVSFIDGVLSEASATVQSLMVVSDKNKFQSKYRSTMQVLEEHLNTLFLIKASLPGEGGSTDDSDSEDEEPPDDDHDNRRTKGLDARLNSPSPDPGLGGARGGSATPTDSEYSKGSHGWKRDRMDTSSPMDAVKTAEKLDDSDTTLNQSQEQDREPSASRCSPPFRVKKEDAPVSSEMKSAPVLKLEEAAQAQFTSSSARSEVFEQVESHKQVQPPVSENFTSDPQSFAEVGQASRESKSVPSSSQGDIRTEEVQVVPEQDIQESAKSSQPCEQEGVKMPPPIGSRVFRRKKREISGKDASINMIMNALNIRQETIETVKEVQHVLEESRGTLALSDVSSELVAQSRPLSQSCVSLKSTSNLSAASSQTPDYGMGPVVPSLTFREGTEIRVVLLEVTSPSLFYVRPEGTDLDSLGEAMTVYYSKHDQEGLGCEPKVGMICCAKFTQDNMYYRAQIIGVTPDANLSLHECQSADEHSLNTHISQIDRFEVEVMYIDYGNQEKIPHRNLHQLVPQFCHMPCQAFCCALAGVLPKDEAKWQMASHLLYAYNTTTLSGTLWTVEDCPVLLLDLRIPGTQQTFSDYLVKNDIAIRTTNEEIKNTYYGGHQAGGEGDQAAFLETVKSMSPKMSTASSVLSSGANGGGDGAYVRQNVHDQSEESGGPSRSSMNDLKGSSRKSSDSNNERCFTPESSDWQNTKVDGNFDHLLDDALAAEDKGSLDNLEENSGEMNISDEEQEPDTSSGKATPAQEGTQNQEASPTKPQYVIEDDAPEGWLTISLGAASPQLKRRSLEVPKNGSIRFMMSHINSPGDFFIHLVDQGTSEILDILNKDLNSMYKKSTKNMMGRFFEGFRPGRGDICCACFTKDKKFYRAMVLEVRNITKGIRREGTGRRLRKPMEQEETFECHVFYLDFGNIEWVPGSKVYPLSPHFYDIPVQAVHCTLANLRPMGIDGKWCNRAVKLFEALTGFDKNFHGQVIADDDELCEPIPLAVLDNTDSSEDKWINTILVEQKLALAIFSQSERQALGSDVGIFDDASETKDEMERMQHWNPMMDDFISERNSVNVDVDDAEVAVLGYKTRPSKTVCKFFGKTKSGCWKGDRCPHLHIDPDDKESRADLEKEEVFCLNDVEAIRPPKEGAWLPVHVSAIFNPGRFYLIFPYGTQSLTNGERDDEGYEGSQQNEETLELMMECLNEYYCKVTRRDRDFVALAPGELVAAQYSGDSSWCRARVIDSDTVNEKVEVFYVDFGNCEWLPESDVRLMEPQFLHMPFQALETFLYGVEPVGGSWSGEARRLFKELVDGRTLFAYVKSRGTNGILSVQLYDTECEENLLINQVLIDREYAYSAEPLKIGSPASTDSGRPSSRAGRKSNEYVEPEEIFLPG